MTFGRHFIHLPAWSLAYGRVPKVANTSIKGTLAKVAGIEHPTLTPTRDAFWSEQPETRVRLVDAQTLRATAPEPFCFAFVREPRDRLLSFFSANVQSWTLSKELGALGFRSDMTLSELVARVCEIRDDDADVHFVSQHRILSGEDGLVPHFVGRYERLSSDWSALRAILKERLGKEFPDLPVTNKVRRAPGLRVGINDPELERRIFARYERDYDLFFS